MFWPLTGTLVHLNCQSLAVFIYNCIKIHLFIHQCIYLGFHFYVFQYYLTMNLNTLYGEKLILLLYC